MKTFALALYLVGSAHAAFAQQPVAADPAPDSQAISNVNERYPVESVAIRGVDEAAVPKPLREALQKLVGDPLDQDVAERLRAELADAFPDRKVVRHIERGTSAGRIIAVFEFSTEEPQPWIPFAPDRSKLVYHGDLGWSYAQDIDFGDGDTRVTAGIVVDDNDDLVERYRGYRLRIEERRIVTRRLGASLEFSRLRAAWDDATLGALPGLGIAEPYHTRRTIEPALTVAASRSLRFSAGVTSSQLDASTTTSKSTGLTGSVTFGRRFHAAGGTHRVDASYLIRTGSQTLESDFVFKRHSGQARYEFRQGAHTVIVRAALGHLDGSAPIFERFTLGDASTLRGWSRLTLAPAGAADMWHQSVEYRFHAAALFVDAGSLWEPGAEARTRLSTGFGLHGDHAFATVAFPLNAPEVGATFLIGIHFSSRN